MEMGGIGWQFEGDGSELVLTGILEGELIRGSKDVFAAASQSANVKRFEEEDEMAGGETGTNSRSFELLGETVRSSLLESDLLRFSSCCISPTGFVTKKAFSSTVAVGLLGESGCNIFLNEERNWRRSSTDDVFGFTLNDSKC